MSDVSDAVFRRTPSLNCQQFDNLQHVCFSDPSMSLIYFHLFYHVSTDPRYLLGTTSQLKMANFAPFLSPLIARILELFASIVAALNTCVNLSTGDFLQVISRNSNHNSHKDMIGLAQCVAGL